MHEVVVPNLGTQITEAELTEWVASEGDHVKAQQVIAILETEKSSYDLETEFKGILHIIKEVSDDKFETGTVIAVIVDSEEEYEKVKSM